jgi:hypothetical protein
LAKVGDATDLAGIEDSGSSEVHQIQITEILKRRLNLGVGKVDRSMDGA